jgi:hypothetical protein
VWARLSTHWYADARVLNLSRDAELFFVRAIAWCKELLTDGVVPRAAVRLFDHKLDQDGEACAAELVKQGLWEPLDDGWRFPPATWARWQGTRAEVEVRRVAEADRKRAYRAQRKADGAP